MCVDLWPVHSHNVFKAYVHNIQCDWFVRSYIEEHTYTCITCRLFSFIWCLTSLVHCMLTECLCIFCQLHLLCMSMDWDLGERPLEHNLLRNRWAPQVSFSLCIHSHVHFPSVYSPSVCPLQANCYCMCLTALHLAQSQYAWVVVPVELGEILAKVGTFSKIGFVWCACTLCWYNNTNDQSNPKLCVYKVATFVQCVFFL